MKQCPSCGEVKELNHFGKDKNKLGGLKYSCKVCRNKENKARRDADPSKHRTVNLAYARSDRGRELMRLNNLRRKYWPHLTNEECRVKYATLLKEQNDSCGLCGEHKSTNRFNLAVDHCHATGKSRGLLCNKCNRFEVGRHTLKTAEMLVAYLKKHAT